MIGKVQWFAVKSHCSEDRIPFPILADTGITLVMKLRVDASSHPIITNSHGFSRSERPHILHALETQCPIASLQGFTRPIRGHAQ